MNGAKWLVIEIDSIWQLVDVIFCTYVEALYIDKTESNEFVESEVKSNVIFAEIMRISCQWDKFIGWILPRNRLLQISKQYTGPFLL